jgi:hypothetical protein
LHVALEERSWDRHLPCVDSCCLVSPDAVAG